ncbi:hypothetical protein G9A89_017035 [Geosiphon pyriformis]|nr:hypothetical protein G9A89_017035 [Geosiphon pyriformis]
MNLPRNLKLSIFPTKALARHHDSIVQQIESMERKTFPKNEVMQIKEIIGKKTNTMLIAYYEKEIEGLTASLGRFVESKESNPRKKKMLSLREADNEPKDKKHLEIAGYLIYSYHSSHPLPITHILKLCVNSSMRRNGIGTCLLQMGLEKTGVPKKSNAELYVDVNRKGAINLYRNFGFKVFGKSIKDYYQDGRDAWLMIIQGPSNLPSSHNDNTKF